jgi:hypothetical protein
MEQHLIFERLIQYDPGQPGITLDVSLSLSAASVNFPTKVDTGVSYCIFERRHGKALGLSIESGLPQPISTVTGRFLTYGHEVTLSLHGFRRLECFVRAAETQLDPEADLDVVIAHEETISSSLGGRSVFDDKHRQQSLF